MWLRHLEINMVQQHVSWHFKYYNQPHSYHIFCIRDWFGWAVMVVGYYPVACDVAQRVVFVSVAYHRLGDFVPRGNVCTSMYSNVPSFARNFSYRSYAARHLSAYDSFCADSDEFGGRCISFRALCGLACDFLRLLNLPLRFVGEHFSE